MPGDGRAGGTTEAPAGEIQAGAATVAASLAPVASGSETAWEGVRGVGRVRGGDGAALDPSELQALVGGAIAPVVSPLMEKVTSAVSSVASAGTVPQGSLLSQGNRVDPRPLLGGPAIYAAVRKSIALAEREVLFQAYDWEVPSEPVSEILAGLRDLQARKAAEREAGGNPPPVRVRIVVDECNSLYDRVRSFNLNSHKLLQTAIAELGLDPSLVDAKTASHYHYSVGALHSKTLVVDNAHVILTSANPQAYEKFETGFYLEGPVAGGLREEFLQLWNRLSAGKKEPLSLSPYLPTEPSPSASLSGVPVLLASRKANGSPFSNDIWHPLGQSYLAVLQNARDRIRIITPNLNDDHIVGELKVALQRGVRVELVLPHTFNDTFQNLPLQGGSNRRVVERLQRFVHERGLDPELFDVRWFRNEVGDPVETCWSHTKYMSVDGQLTIIGSSNLDTQSINHSREVNAVLDSRAVTRAWDEKLFEPVFERASPVQLEPAPI